MLSRKIPILLPYIFKLVCSIVQDLHIAGNVLLPIELAELGKGELGNTGQVQLVIPDRQEIVVNLLKDWVGK